MSPFPHDNNTKDWMLIIRYARTNAVHSLQCFSCAEMQYDRMPAITCARYRPIHHSCASYSYVSTVGAIKQTLQLRHAYPSAYYSCVHSTGHSIIAPNQQTEGRIRVCAPHDSLVELGRRVGRTGPHSPPTGTLIRCCHQYTHGDTRAWRKCI